MTLRNLTILFLFISTNIMLAQSVDCENAEPFCAGTGSELVFENTSRMGEAEAGPDFGCLDTQPNPAWFFLRIDQAGNFDFQIEQNTQSDFAGTGLDVDFIAYGPFANKEVCTTDADVNANLISTNIVGCSYLATAVENFSLNNTNVGEIYILLITNFQDQPGFIRLVQTNFGSTGAGATDCSIVDDIKACEGDVIPELDGTASSAVGYRWLRDGVVITETGPILTNIVEPSAVYVSEALNSLGEVIFTNQFDVIFEEAPVVESTVDLIQCDNNRDGLAPFNLNEANQLISNNFAVENFRYFRDSSFTDEILGNDIIAYTNPNPFTGSVVYVVITNTNDCSRTAQINLSVGATQIPINFSRTFTVCDDVVNGISTNTDGSAVFDFSSVETELRNGPLSGIPNIDITYYTNEADAFAEINAITNISSYRSLSTTTPIIARVDSNDVNSCLGFRGIVNLVVDPVPTANFIADFVLCNDDGATAQFDLSLKDEDVQGAQTENLIITYHASAADAFNNSNALSMPFTNTSNPQPIFVRSQFDTNNNGLPDLGECFTSEMSFDLIVLRNPVLNMPDVLIGCSNGFEAIFDLTASENQITGGDSTITLSYFETQADLDANNPIPTPDNYTNRDLNTTIIVLATGANGCFSTTTLPLETTLYADINLALNTLEECEVDQDGFDAFDLTRVELELLNGLNRDDFTIVYYEDEAEAIAGSVNSIRDATAYVNTEATMQTIYIRITPVVNDCYQIVPLPLLVNSVPRMDVAPQYVICLDAQSTSIPPVLIPFLPIPPIDTGLNENDFTFQWYEGANAVPENEIVGAIRTSFTPIAVGTYTVVATDVITGCTIPATTTVVASFPPEEITAEVITDAFSDNDTIQVTVVGEGDYEFSLDGIEWQTENRFENLKFGQYTVFVRDVLSCNALQSNTVTVIDYPRFLTPNNDGINDTWNIQGAEEIPDAIIYIFDRQGKLLKQILPNGQGWNGLVNGVKLPANDYWFTVEYNEPNTQIRKQFKAHFTLKR